MLDEELRSAWRFRKHAFPISPQPYFTSDGLTLGAGTVLVAAEGMRRLKNLHGQESRVLALLSAAYGKAIASSVLGNVERAAKAVRAAAPALDRYRQGRRRLRATNDAGRGKIEIVELTPPWRRKQ